MVAIYVLRQQSYCFATLPTDRMYDALLVSVSLLPIALILSIALSMCTCTYLVQCNVYNFNSALPLHSCNVYIWSAPR